jgi:GNAT superfamily N-acetyltransferase
MADEYTIAVVDDPEETAVTVIGFGIRDYNKQHGGDDKHRRLYVFLCTSNGTVVGGLIGSTFWDWLHVDLLWVTDELRGRGFGHRILTLAEDEARRRGAHNAYLDTFSFQAPDFYERNGYQVFGELPDFPQGYRRYFLTKPL